jgi:hypothetical protein
MNNFFIFVLVLLLILVISLSTYNVEFFNKNIYSLIIINNKNCVLFYFKNLNENHYSKIYKIYKNKFINY